MSVDVIEIYRNYVMEDKEYFLLPVEAEEITKLVKEHERLRQETFNSTIEAVERIAKVIERIHEIKDEIENIFSEYHP